MSNLTATLIQSPLFWEEIDQNLDMFTQKIGGIDTPTDLVVLPEMFTTGFTMNPKELAEPMEGKTMQWMQKLASTNGFVITGSLIVKVGHRYFNRLIWMPPDGNYSFFDKKHLFSYAGEDKHYTAGSGKAIVSLKGWKVMPLICYDLRFPVFSRNSHHPERGFAYDCILNVANWPGSRSHAWRVLLMARAIENQSYVIGVNRVGEDGNNILYSGDSVVLSPKGESLTGIMPFKEVVETVVMPRCELDGFRDAFRPWADWDDFTM